MPRSTRTTSPAPGPSFEIWNDLISHLRIMPGDAASCMTKRVPLQELPISSSGNPIRSRYPVMRPIPSLDKENHTAVITAILERTRLINDQLRELCRIVDELEAILNLQRQRAILPAPAPSSALSTDQIPATHVSAHARLSMSMNSDESDSEPDLSVLGMTRPGNGSERHVNSLAYDDETLSQQDQYEAEDTSVEDQAEEQEAIALIDPATAGLKEISNLGKFTVSSHKPGNGVEALRSDDLKLFWQSDGPQPHRLTVYFVKRVGIRDIRFYVDYQEDESYTPTKIVFRSGTSENNLIEFATMNLENPVGWQQVPIAGAGGDPDGNTLVSYVLQMQILENHQNGKDTHLRGIKIYAFDPESTQGASREDNPVDDVVTLLDRAMGLDHQSLSRHDSGEGGFSVPDFMREPEIR
ncbi:hypothetical protein S7711_07446 [Stachybotrys chartarum IBT 7711]|uniref:DOC domain-containing protein n=1 Tax=Stachybotrys chartarum (strain CBS 109288 / IBT 7711) TaxID=1280523 RepID=A0A084AFK5_STACB|nr:hypothetical protein S7711_07446 [Stachybotrys chartarum IBT 7711]